MTYAGFWRRAAASFVDSIFLWIVNLFLAVSMDVVKNLFFGTPEFSPQPTFFFFNTIKAVMIVWIYSAVMESSVHQATLGKLALGIKVVDLKGNKISFGKASGRYFGKIISACIFLVGYLMVAFTEKKQALHDMMAGCLVVNKSVADADEFLVGTVQES